MSRASRSDHLRETAQLLWPAPLQWELTRRRSWRTSPAYQEFVVIPSARAPRMLVPARPRLAAAALRNSQSGSGTRERLRALLLAAAFRIHVGALVFRDRLRVTHDAASGDGTETGTFETSLKSHIDACVHIDGSWALPVTRARANRKPVLQVLSPDARTVAFVKVGTNALTRDLVRSEQRSLEALRGFLSTLRVPGVISGSAWRDLALLVLSPLPLARRGPVPTQERVLQAALEITRALGTSVGPLRGSAYWDGLRERLAALQDSRSAALLRTWDMIDEHVGSVELEFGAWHGDWAPWNMASVDNELLVWDFERFGLGVPVGFDLLHLDLQTRILNPSRRAESLILARLEEAPSLLRPAGVSARTSYVVFSAYLLEIACRWLVDRQEETGWGSVLDDIIGCADRAGARARAENRDEETTR